MGAGRVSSEEAHSEPTASPVLTKQQGPPEVARVLQLQRTIGNRATTRQLQRYKILGPWNKGQAVHETLTVLSVGDAIEQLEAEGIDPGELMAGFDVDKLPDESKKASFDPVDAPASFQQFIRGVVWADDPKGLLFDKEEDATDYSSGYAWYSSASSACHASASSLGATSGTQVSVRSSSQSKSPCRRKYAPWRSKRSWSRMSQSWRVRVTPSSILRASSEPSTRTTSKSSQARRRRLITTVR